MTKRTSVPDIKLQVANTNGIKFEKLIEFSNSLCRDVYADAFEKTAQLIENNKNYKEENHWHHERTYNIIPFCGRRGMGKTSAMKSFLGAIDSFEKSTYEKFKSEYEKYGRAKLPDAEKLADYEFICLECIDASLLEELEDIFEVVLARMLSEIIKVVRGYSGNAEWEIKTQSKYFRYRKEDIMAKVAAIHKDLCNIGTPDKRRESGKGSVGILQELSGSLDLREKFEELVPLYLKMMSKKGASQADDKRFLVISIDDLDMSRRGYEILEQVHRYFMVPDVLIYITISDEELVRLCKSHFGGEEKVAKSYMDKVLPFSKRIYMPKISVSNVKIMPKDRGVKETFLVDIAKKTGVYFDICGMKRHFYEPEDIRSLVNLYDKINGMVVLEDTEERKEQYVVNSRYLMQDVLERMMFQKLTTDYREMFKDVFVMEPERQGREILARIVRLVGVGKCVEDYRWFGYSYGELMRFIYTLGRVNSEYKGVVQCILAMQTVQLTQFYYQGEIERIIKCMNGAVIGSWGNKLVPKVEVNNGSVAWGYMKGNLNYNKGDELPICMSCKDGREISRENLTDILYEFLEDEQLQVVYSVALLSMFISYTVRGGQKYIIDIDMKEAPGPEGADPISENNGSSKEKSSDSNDERVNLSINQISMGLDTGRVVFDIMGFVLRCQDYKNIIKRVEHAILEACRQAFLRTTDTLKDKHRQVILEMNDGVEERLKSIIEDKLKGFKTDIEKWRNEYGIFPLPVYSTDIFYNIVKRAKAAIEESNMYFVNASDILDSLKNTYEKIGAELGKEESKYNPILQDEGINILDFKGCFEKCPIVDMISNRTYPESFSLLFEKCVTRLAGSTSILRMEKILDDEY